MQRSRLPVAITLWLVLAACGKPPSAPTPGAPPPAQPATPAAPAPPGTALQGLVVNALSSAPIAGAVVSIDGRYTARTDATGNYTLAGSAVLGPGYDFVYVSASGYEPDYRFLGTAGDFRLFPIERIEAGRSAALIVTPDDSLCVNNMQDFPGLGPSYHCHAVRVVAARAGRLSIEVRTADGALHDPVEVETAAVSNCCSERIQNPTALDVTPGLEVVVRVEIPWNSTSSQSFVVNTQFFPVAGLEKS
jgi:hypothetical protein